MQLKTLSRAVARARELLPEAIALAESQIDRACELLHHESLCKSALEPAQERKQGADCVLRCLEGLRKVQVDGISEPVAKAVNESLDAAITEAKAELDAATATFDAAREALCIARVSLNQHLKPHQPFIELQTLLKHLPRKLQFSTVCRLFEGSKQLELVAENVMNAAKAWQPAIGVFEQKSKEYELLLRAYQHMQKVAAYAPNAIYKGTEAELLSQIGRVLTAKIELKPAAEAAFAQIRPVVALKTALDEVVAELK